VAFLSFAIASQSSLPLWSAATLAALVNLVSVPSSILGNELAMRFGRRVWIILVMASGSLMGVLMSLMVGLPWWMVTMAVGLHSILIMADSASLTAGLVSSVPSHVKGAAFGFYSLLGFGAGAVGPALFGLALDLAGGQQLPSAWALAFLVTGLGCLAYPFIDRRLFGTSPFHRG
jgi:MFS family permease